MDYGDIAFYILELNILKIRNTLYWFLNLNGALKSLVYMVTLLMKRLLFGKQYEMFTEQCEIVHV